MVENKTSEKWCGKLGLSRDDIIDPDGWDRTNFEYSFDEEKISEEEFIERLSQSTVRFTPSICKLFGVTNGQTNRSK